MNTISCGPRTGRRVGRLADCGVRAWTSNRTRILLEFSLILSPLGRHSMRLSSSTVFMFSIQIASTADASKW